MRSDKPSEADEMAGSAAAIVLGAIGLAAFVKWRQTKRTEAEAARTLPSSPLPKLVKPLGRA